MSRKGKRFSLGAYRNRNEMLERMGFKNYQDYLNGDLWLDIKARVLFMYKTCYCCGQKAQLVHHMSYEKDVLLGKNLKMLKSICHRCHESIEFTKDNQKLSLHSANGKMKSLRDNRLHKRSEEKKKRKIKQNQPPTLGLSPFSVEYWHAKSLERDKARIHTSKRQMRKLSKMPLPSQRLRGIKG